MVGKSWNAFTQRVLVVKHFSGIIMHENPVGARHPLTLSSDTHALGVTLPFTWAI